MLFSNQKNQNGIKLNIDDYSINRVYSTKFLGVLIDHKLNWKDHINLVKNKLAKSIAIIYKASQVVDKSALITLYYSLFLPYMNYCVEVWGNTYKSNVQPIFLNKNMLYELFIMQKEMITRPQFSRFYRF